MILDLPPNGPGLFGLPKRNTVAEVRDLVDAGLLSHDSNVADLAALLAVQSGSTFTHHVLQHCMNRAPVAEFDSGVRMAFGG